MTERERWTVYPLLFLSLGIAMRSQITSSLKLHEITCDTLKGRTVQLVGEDGGVRLVLAALPPGAGGGGLIEILSGDGKPEVVLEATPVGGLVKIGSPEGMSQVVLGVAPQGGYVDASDSQAKSFRRLAANFDPRAHVLVGPPPAPPAEKPAGEPAERQSEKPTSEKPAGEKPPGTNNEPAEKPAQP